MNSKDISIVEGEENIAQRRKEFSSKQKIHCINNLFFDGEKLLT